MAVGAAEVDGDATVVVIEAGEVLVVDVPAVVGEPMAGGATFRTVVGVAGTAVEVVGEWRGTVVERWVVVLVGDTTTTGTASGGGEPTSR